MMRKTVNVDPITLEMIQEGEGFRLEVASLTTRVVVHFPSRYWARLLLSKVWAIVKGWRESQARLEKLTREEIAG